MNVVGKVGNLISQGVYSVATPFHPFGGAVDIIVVQQQDGTFRSTPWYVRFGKFQGVLKGAEKIVRISVNGIEANFHMFLDNSGEAYFIREVSNKGSESNGIHEDLDVMGDRGDACSCVTDVHNDNNVNDNNSQSTVDLCRLENTLSNAEDVHLQDERDSSLNRIERVESESEIRFYGFQDEQSSIDGSVGLSEYGPNRFESLDSMDDFVESQDSDSEVVLVSVDGHILMAPISSEESNTAENVQLSTPQFHLGPGKGADFCKGNEGFSTFFSDINTAGSNIKSDSNICSMNNELEDAVSIQRKEVFKSCLELSETVQFDNPEKTPDKTSHSAIAVDKSQFKSVEVINTYELSSFSSKPSNSSIEVACVDETIVHTENIAFDSSSVHSIDSDSGLKDEQLEGTQSIPQISMPEAECSKGIQTDGYPRFEISLCGNLLHAGMGLAAATEAFDAHRISEEEFKHSFSLIMKNENLIIRYRERYFSWDKAAPFVLGQAAFGIDLPFEPKDSIPIEQDETSKTNDESGISPSPSRRGWRLWPIPFRRVKTLEHTRSTSSNEEVFVESENGSQYQSSELTPESNSAMKSPHKQFIRTNIPTTEEIASLNLKEGQNMVTFSFSTRVLGRQQVDAHIYLWKWNTRIVISDVDGTITKSDVLGQFMPLVGKDWTQSGVARLFSAIKENGYQLLFLSARAIVQAYLTRSFLLNLKQDGNTLPNGPVVISPDGLFPSLYREVIRRAPHEFKIACLEDIKALFPSDYNPFYAGFGNRDTDELSYRKIGIPKGKIFIINPRGEVAINHRIDVKSYTSLHTLVNDMFPPTSMVEQEDFNSWNYWKMPLPEID